MEEVNANEERGQSSFHERFELMKDSFKRCLRFGLRPLSREEFHLKFPGLPTPVATALFELFQQVLAHVESHSSEEFEDIVKEYGIEDKLGHIEQLSRESQVASLQQAGTGIPQDPSSSARAAEATARIAAKQQEVLHLKHLLAQASTARDHLQQVAETKRSVAQQLEQRYCSLGEDVKQVYEASKGGNVRGAPQPPPVPPSVRV